MADEVSKKGGGRTTITADDTVKFLITCIKFANQGKIDWKAVAAECDIVTAGAAVKRYTRLLKANGADKNKSAADPDDENEDGSAAAVTPKPRTVTAITPKPRTITAKTAASGDSKKAPALKKRKVGEANEASLQRKLEHEVPIFGNVVAVKSEEN